MASSTNEILSEGLGFIRIYKDGHYERLQTVNIVPAGIDDSTGVNSKDVVFSPESNISARLYIPKTATPTRKLPLLIFYHGGGFVVESAYSSTYHKFLNIIVSESNVVAVSVDYRLAPEFPLPTAYEDSWEAIKWIAEHVNGAGPEPWLNEYADLGKIFIAGDSAGGNITHHMGIRVGSDCPPGLRVLGLILLHPYFWGSELVGNESDWMRPGLPDDINALWGVAIPEGVGLDAPYVNPGKDPKLAGLGCSKILLCRSGNDFMRDRGRNYKELIEKSGWKGHLELVEDNEESHVFFLNKPSSPNTLTLRKKICAFINSA